MKTMCMPLSESDVRFQKKELSHSLTPSLPFRKHLFSFHFFMVTRAQCHAAEGRRTVSLLYFKTLP